MSVRLPSPGRSLLTHAHICESINIALTRNLFDDRSESAWHFLNSGWHSPAGSGSQLQSGARSRGSGELAGMRTRSHPHSAPRLGDPAAQAGWLSRFLEGEKGGPAGVFPSRHVWSSYFSAHHCPLRCLHLGCPCHCPGHAGLQHLFLGCLCVKLSAERAETRSCATGSGPQMSGKALLNTDNRVELEGQVSGQVSGLSCCPWPTPMVTEAQTLVGGRGRES